MTEQTDEPMEDVEQIGEFLRVKPSWVYSNAALLGGIKVGKYWRFRRSVAIELLKQRTVKRGVAETARVRC